MSFRTGAELAIYPAVIIGSTGIGTRRSDKDGMTDASWARTTGSPMLELDIDENLLRDNLVGCPFMPSAGGLIDVTVGPGLGINIDEELIEKFCKA